MIVQFEIHASAPQVLIDFYSKLFGWSFEKWEGVDFWQISTRDGASSAVAGGLVQRRGPAPSEGQPVNAFVCTVRVDSIDSTLALAEEVGGRVAVPKMQIPGVGWLGYLKDPDGNLVGIQQPE